MDTPTLPADDAAALLRGLRRAAGWTQSQLGAQAGTSQSAVARYETGAVTPALSTLDRLATTLGHRLTLAAVVVPDPGDVALACELLAMTPGDRLRSLSRYAALRDRVRTAA